MEEREVMCACIFVCVSETESKRIREKIHKGMYRYMLKAKKKDRNYIPQTKQTNKKIKINTRTTGHTL